MLLFTRAIRKTASSTLSAALQLFLLIKWRSLRTLLRSDFRASTESERRRVRVNCNLKKQEQPQDAWICCTLRLFYKSLPFTRAIRKTASSMLSAASQLIFAHKAALPPWFLVHRFSCEHGICPQETTSEL